MRQQESVSVKTMETRTKLCKKAGWQ